MTQSFFFSKRFTDILGDYRLPSRAQRAFLRGCQNGGRQDNGPSSSVDTFSDHTYSCTTGFNAIAFYMYYLNRWKDGLDEHSHDHPQ